MASINLTKLAAKRVEEHEYPEDLRDLRADIYRDYLKFMDGLIEDGRKVLPGDFYMVIVNERHKDITTKNCYRFVGRACVGVETPKFHHDVWKYHKESGSHELLWSLPPRRDAYFMYRHKHEVLPQYYPVLEQVLAYYEGKLHKRCDEENEKAVKALNGK